MSATGRWRSNYRRRFVALTAVLFAVLLALSVATLPNLAAALIPVKWYQDRPAVVWGALVLMVVIATVLARRERRRDGHDRSNDLTLAKSLQVDKHGVALLPIETNPSSNVITRDPPKMANIPPGVMVRRPALEAALRKLLLQPDTKGRCVALVGQGGFGKTTIAELICEDQAITNAFPDGILWVDLSRDHEVPPLTAKINNLCAVLQGTRPQTDDPNLASRYLAELIGDRRMLIVVDDVWHQNQLSRFMHAAPNCVRLITTRNQQVLPTNTQMHPIESMTEDEARQLITIGIPGLENDALADLPDLAGGWAILLSLINGAVARNVQRGWSNADAVITVRDELARNGPATFDPRNSDDRRSAISASMEVTFRFLRESDTPDDLKRYLDLAAFPRGDAIPLSFLEPYWKRRAGHDTDARRLCREFADLSLISRYARTASSETIVIHDVVHQFLERRAHMHDELVQMRSDLRNVWRDENTASQ